MFCTGRDHKKGEDFKTDHSCLIPISMQKLLLWKKNVILGETLTFP